METSEKKKGIGQQKRSLCRYALGNLLAQMLEKMIQFKKKLVSVTNELGIEASLSSRILCEKNVSSQVSGTTEILGYTLCSALSFRA